MEEYRMVDGKDFEDFIRGFLSFIKQLISYMLTALKENYTAAVLVFLLIVSIGSVCWHYSKAFYEAAMVCSFRELNKKTYGEMVHSLDMLAQSHSYNALSKQLSIPLQQAQCIVSIEGKNMAGSMLFEDITADRSPMYFYVRATNNTVYLLLQPALLHYLNTGIPYLNTKTRMDSADISAREKYLSRNIVIADSVIATIHIFLKNAGSYIDTSISGQKFASLMKYKSDMETQLVAQHRMMKELTGNVEIMHGFTPPDHPASNESKILKLTLVASLISSCGTALLLKALHSTINPRLA